MSSSGWCLCDASEQQADSASEAAALAMATPSSLDKTFIQQLGQTIAGTKPDRGGLLTGAELQKPELLAKARSVLLDSTAELLTRHNALVLLQWCAAKQPLAPQAKVKEEVEFYMNVAQNVCAPETKLWASAALVMFAGQPATQLLVIGDEGSAQTLVSLLREALVQPDVQLHILAHCARFVSLLTSSSGQEQLLQLCIHQLTEPLLLLPGEGGDTATAACEALLALIKARPQAAAAAVNETRRGVAALVAALERELGELAAVSSAVKSRQAAAAAAAAAAAGEMTAAVLEEKRAAAAGKEDVSQLDFTFSEDAAGGDEVEQAAGRGSVSAASGSGRQGQQEEPALGQQQQAYGGLPATCLAGSLLDLLHRLLEQAKLEAASIAPPHAAAATSAALAHGGTVSLLVRSLQLGKQAGGADAMRCLALLLRVSQAQAQLLAAEGAVDEVASHWRLAPAAAVRALWHMREQLKSDSTREALLQLLGYPAGPAPSGHEDAQHYGHVLQCVKTMVVGGHWGSGNQAAASPALLAALDLAHRHLGELTTGCGATYALMELWALLSRGPETALQLAVGSEAAADGTTSSFPCCVSAAMARLQQAAPAPLHSSYQLSPHLATLLNLLRAAGTAQQQQQQQPPHWTRQLQDTILTVIRQQLERLSTAAPEPVDLHALMLCSQLCALFSSDDSLRHRRHRHLYQLSLLKPQLLRLGTSSHTAQAQSEAASGGVEGPWPAAVWSSLDVLQAKLGLMQRFTKLEGQGPDPEAAAAARDVLFLLLGLLLTGVLAADFPPPASDYSSLIGATPDSMRRQVLQLLRQAASALPMGSRTWAMEELLERALDAAASCKAGQPRKQELANCVALASLWLDLQLQGDVDVEQMDAPALELHRRSLQARLRGMVPWALQLVALLMDCPAAANTPIPAIAAPPGSVFQAVGAILVQVSLHSTKSVLQLQARACTPLDAHRWLLKQLAAATAEERSILALSQSQAQIQRMQDAYAGIRVRGLFEGHRYGSQQLLPAELD